MSGPLDDAPTVFLLGVLVVSLAFVGLPSYVGWRLLRDARRGRTWSQVDGVVTATRVQSYGSGTDQRIVVRGRYTYRGPDGVEHTGRGDLNGVWMEERDGVRHLRVLVDPADPSRSAPYARRPLHPVVLVLVTLFLSVFWLVGAGLLLGSTSVLLAG